MRQSISLLAELAVALPKFIANILCALVASLIAAAAPALATQVPVPATVALTKINLVSQTDREAHLQLVVEPRVNGFQALSNNPRDPTIALALTTRTASAVSPRDLHGFVRASTSSRPRECSSCTSSSIEERRSLPSQAAIGPSR